MQKLKGNKITSIRLAIGKELSEQNNTIFITNNLEKQPLYIQKIEKFEAGWNDITLDTPFNISGEDYLSAFNIQVPEKSYHLTVVQITITQIG